MIKTNNNKALVSPIRYIYLLTLDQNIPQEEILKTDLTNEFYQELQNRIKRNNLITISIRGEPTSGKSTVALAIKHDINKIIIKNKKNTKIDEYETICSDQIEFNRFVMKNHNNVCVTIDEWNELGNTGENSSIEQGVFTFYTEVCAQRYIHRVMCTPRCYSQYDKTANILLDVIGRDTKQQTTMCRIYYHDGTLGVNFPLGVVHINVKDTIKSTWYKKYREKKFKRIELLDKYGKRDIRELEFSMIVLQAYDQLKPLIDPNTKFPPEIITTTVRHILSQNKVFYSIIGKYSLHEPIRALLNSEHLIKKIEKKLQKPRPTNEHTALTKQLEYSKQMHKELVQNEKNNVKILEEYNKIQ